MAKNKPTKADLSAGQEELTGKMSRFCEEYLIDFNATQAAIRAGYSEKTAYAIGAENLKKPQIQERLKSLMEDTGQKLGITRERVLQEIGRLAFSDIRKLFTIDGALKPITDLDEDSAAILSSVEVREEDAVSRDIESDEKIVTGTVKKVKLWDKTKALEMLAKHLKIYSDAPVNNVNIEGQNIVFK